MISDKYIRQIDVNNREFAKIYFITLFVAQTLIFFRMTFFAPITQVFFHNILIHYKTHKMYYY